MSMKVESMKEKPQPTSDKASEPVLRRPALFAARTAWFSLFLGASLLSAQSLPSDIDKESLSRFPVIKRDQLDDKGKKAYDIIAGGPGKLVLPTGPAAIGLYSPESYEPLRTLNDYLRRDGVLGDRLTELAILVASRELDEAYVWGAHEPAALKAGIPQSVIDIVKYGRDTHGIEEKQAAIIRFGRQLFREKSITSQMFSKTVDLFGRQGIVELTTLMGYYGLNHFLLKMADQHLPPDRQGLLPPR
jgi:4-carboxymuconolactone decarboxylase